VETVINSEQIRSIRRRREKRYYKKTAKNLGKEGELAGQRRVNSIWRPGSLDWSIREDEDEIERGKNWPGGSK